MSCFEIIKTCKAFVILQIAIFLLIPSLAMTTLDRVSSNLTRCILETVKETRSVTMNIFGKKKILFKSFENIELSYVFTINMFSAAEN